ncbi:YlaI family protein [Alkalihalobacillus deserti]|uniref:YlaI family protein n=1 Tax=Alkalihalobacillus deserti TaxID=2879466 RepID=UPI001D138FBB|nr:YlaI family protein [Alkalihalobacillus deserti]
MRVKCVLCDKIDKLDDQLPLAKRLRNRPIHTYMCDTCYDRIKKRTEARKEAGSFQLAFEKKEESDWV